MKGLSGSWDGGRCERGVEALFYSLRSVSGEQQRELIVLDGQGTQQQGPETATETVSGELDNGILTELGRPTNYDSNSSMHKNSC